MADIFSKAERSDIMSRIRSKNTKAERTVFKYLRQNKIYFQKHYDKAPGKPDIALPRKKKAVFIDGDFWHGRNPESVKKLPKKYWQTKIAGNILRDEKNFKLLQKQGWQLLRIWEGDINKKQTQQEHLKKISKFLKT